MNNHVNKFNRNNSDRSNNFRNMCCIYEIIRNLIRRSDDNKVLIVIIVVMILIFVTMLINIDILILIRIAGVAVRVVVILLMNMMKAIIIARITIRIIIS